jgi:hypothetical protein
MRNNTSLSRLLKHVPKFFRCVRMFSTRVRPPAPYERKAFSKERERKEPQRKSLGFHIQLGFTAIALSSAFRGHMTSLSLSLYEDLKSALQRHRRERIEAFPVSLVFCFVFCFRFLFEQTETFFIYRKAHSLLGKNPRLCLEVRFVFSLVVCVSLSFSARVNISKERESVVFFSFQSRFYRVSLLLSVSVLFLVVNKVCSLKDREREN